MATNDVSVVVGEVLEELIHAATSQALHNGDEVSPLATTPRVATNRSPPSHRPLQMQVPARKSLFSAGAVDESRPLDRGIIMVDTPDDIGPSNNAEPDPDLPVPETLKDRLFSEGYDSDGLRVEYDDAAKELYESANYNDIKVGCNGIDEVTAPIAVAAPADQVNFQEGMETRSNHLSGRTDMWIPRPSCV